MDASHIRLVQQSLLTIAPLDHPMSDILARELSNVADDLPDQDDTRGDERRRHALSVLTDALRLLHAPERIRHAVERNGVEAEPVRQIDFDCAGNALIRAAKKTQNGEFTPDLWRAWVEALCDVSRILSKTASSVAPARVYEPA